MSKKMLKRSLALGALMAFVITGSAMAAELTITYNKDNDKYSATGTGINESLVGDTPDEIHSKLTNISMAGKNAANKNVIGNFGTETSNNVIIINGGYYNSEPRIYGAYSDSSNSNNNTVKVSNVNQGTLTGNAQLSVIGGWAQNDANGNTVTVENVVTNYFVYGGDAQCGNSNDNSVTIKNSTVKYVNGGFARYDSNNDNANKMNNSNNNTVIITDSTITESVQGGAAGGYGNAIGNKVEVTNLIFTSGDGSGGGALESGYTEAGNAENNILIVNGENTEIGVETFGGRAQDSGNAIGNEVTINAGVFNNSSRGIVGGITENKGTEFHNGTAGDALRNSVTINGGTVNTKVYGGYSTKGNANENTVTITGGNINNRVYGGYGAIEASNNTVNIAGNANVSFADLYGGNVEGFSGNTLNISDGWSGGVKSIQNFNEINIEEAQWGEAVINVTETLALNDTAVNIETVRVAGDDETFAPNGSSVLIKSGSITGDVSADSSVNVFKGVATIYDATVVKDGNDVKIQLAGEDTATYNAGEMNPQVLVIGESRAAATAFTNQGSDLIETGLDALARDKAEADTKVFAAVYGSEAEYATGSEVKVNGWSGIVGVGKTNANGLTIGAFFENGEGNYRTYNDVNGEFMRGDGNTCYNGGGFLVRKDNANGVYTEASLRVGNLQNELRNAVRGSEGLTGYDIDTFYYGAHVGVGKIIPRGNDGDSIDVYGKFIYTHHDSEDFTIDGDKFHFDSVDSERLRLGFRINEVQTNKLTMYYGVAWEYEFGGDSDNTVVGYDLSTPSLGGSSVIGEVGMHYTASEKWSFDLNARAYGGQRDGFSGSVQANYAF